MAKQLRIPIEACEFCGKLYIPQNARQTICKAHRCLLASLEKYHAPSKYHATGGKQWHKDGHRQTTS